MYQHPKLNVAYDFQSFYQAAMIRKVKFDSDLKLFSYISDHCLTFNRIFLVCLLIPHIISHTYRMLEVTHTNILRANENCKCTYAILNQTRRKTRNL